MPRHLLALAALFVASPLFAQDATWKAGFGRANITPREPMWMSGYAARTAPAEGKETDLWAKAAVLQAADGRKLVLVTLDLVGIDRDMSATVCGRIRTKYELPREAVCLSVSHTHCGPVIGSNLRSMYFFDAENARQVNEYTSALPGLILKAVDDAAGALEPVTLAHATGTTDFAVNRRENPEADVPARRETGTLKGPVDHAVPVLAARDAKGTLKGVVFGYACHATTLAFQKWCGDYPGFATIELEKAHPGTTAMFVAGCGADQNPIPRRSLALAKGYGKQLADAVGAVLGKPMDEINPAFAATYHTIDLPLNDVPTRETLIMESMSENKYIASRANMWLKRLRKGEEIPPAIAYPVQAWRLGDHLTLVTLGGEVVVDYATRLKKELGPNLWVMGYANDVMAYIPSLRVLNEGGYEGATSMIYYGIPSVWGPKVEELIVAEATRQVKAVRGDSPAAKPSVVSVEKIWDAGKHNAFTDLIRWRDKWYCTFRESDAHVGGDGKLRVLESTDGKTWESVALVTETGIDLRDPKLSITPDGRLMIVAGGSVYEGKALKGRQPRVTFSTDAREWSAPRRVLTEGEWLWRVTWHDGKCYGISYAASARKTEPADGGTEPPGPADWKLKLVVSDDGVKYTVITHLDVPGHPNETTLRFLPGGKMVALVRREGGNRFGWIGSSDAPYTTWAWHETTHRIGGPNFIRLPDGTLIAGGRSYPGGAKMALARMTADGDYTPVLTLPSGGDTSYPGLVWHDGLLWVSYYSSHEGKTSIYLAKVKVPGVK